MSIANFPALNAEEFVEACHYLDRRYRQATLGLLRMRWKLSIKAMLHSDFMYLGTSPVILSITRTLEDDGALDLDLDSLHISGQQARMDFIDADETMMESEASDKAILEKLARRDCGSVTYDVVLHPTYRMPCLYFRFFGLPETESNLNIDTVFRRLVPDAYKEGLRNYGVGGISIDEHPVYGEPCFFLHPCLVGDSMSAFQCSLEDYLAVWIGLTGACVGLSIPKEMMMP